MDVNIHDAKTNLSKLLERVSLGEEITICKAGRPVARLAPLRGTAKARRPGSAKGDFVVPAGFDDPLPEEILVAFHS